MNEMSYSLRLGAKDDSQAGLRSWQSSIMGAVRAVSKPITIPLKIAGAGLGLLRDINLGLKPVLDGIDTIIERGTALDATRKSFISQVGGGAKYADQLAERLVAASHGTLRIAEAMQLANRAIVAGIDTSKALPVILDFASKKAVTTGMDFGGAMERIIMGLSRGSAAILDDFGLLNDGLEGVQRSYEAIKGKGAWEQLGPAAQKAELIRQAMEDMHRQLGRIGVKGTETVFVWKQIKTQIGDATDKLMAAVGRSESLKGILGGVRDVIGGATRHLEKGGSLGELVWGKTDKEGKPTGSGGLWGGVKAVTLDLGEALGRGILGGALKGFSLLPDLFNAAWEGLKSAWTWAVEQIPPAIITAFQWLKTDFLPALKTTLTEWRRETIDALAGWFKGYMVTPEGEPTTFGRLMGVNKPGEDGWWRQWNKDYGTKEKAFFDWFDRYTFIGRMVNPAATSQPAGATRLTGVPVLQSVIATAIGSAAMGITGGNIFQRAGRAAKGILGGGVLGGDWRAKGWIEDWQGDFPMRDTGRRAAPTPTGYIPEEEFALNIQERRRRRAELSRMDRDLEALDPGSARRESLIRREAWKRTQTEIKRLRSAGRTLRRGDTVKIRRRIAETLRRQADDERRQLMDRRGRLAGDMADNGPAGRKADEGEAAYKTVPILEAIRDGVRDVAAAIGGVERAATG